MVPVMITKPGNVCGVVWAAALGVLALASGAAYGQDRALRPVRVEQKRALLIGNAQYLHTSPLTNTVSDVRALERALLGLGFDEVTRLEDQSLREMAAAALGEFARGLGAGDLALFYFSGHGLQVEQENYLLPVDFERTVASEVAYTALAANRVRARLEGTGAKVRVLVLDACRNNPFGDGRSASEGLAAMEPQAEGTLIAYSTGEGTVASDNLAGNLGLYMTHLLPEFERPEVDLWGAFKNAQASVWEASGRKQFPALYDRVIGKVYLRGAPSVPPRDSTPASPPWRPPVRERTATDRWERIKETEQPEELREYAREYSGKPGSEVWVKLAELRLQRLETARLEREAGVAWAAIRELNSAEALEVYVATYAEVGSAAGWVREARERLAELEYKARAAASWTAIEETESVEELEGYIGEYRGVPVAAELVRQAEARLAELRRQRAASIVEVARLALEQVRETGDVATLESYIDSYESVSGASDLVREARERLDELRVLQARKAVEAMEFVWIPAGKFQMGSKGRFADDDERPVRQVRITEGFWMGKYKVTQGQWLAVMGGYDPILGEFEYRKICGKTCPVWTDSWENTQQFIERLNALEGGRRYRLPTEAEWEYAARAGSRTDTPLGNLKGNWEVENAWILNGIAWYSRNSEVSWRYPPSRCPQPRSGGTYDGLGVTYKDCGPHPIGLKTANAFGLHDTLGNLREWVSDWYGEYRSGEVTDPSGPSTGSARVARGCAHDEDADECRVSNRSRWGQAFRLVKTK